jgi:cytochrome oxidase Cu insertion factor (SCO1/SenC/PrrC family)
VFVSADPERDTPATTEYARYFFSPECTRLPPPDEQLPASNPSLRSLHMVYARSVRWFADGDYSVDHTAHRP